VAVQIVWKNGLIGLVRGSIRKHSGERSGVMDRQGGAGMEKFDRSPVAGCGESPAASLAHSIAKSAIEWGTQCLYGPPAPQVVALVDECDRIRFRPST